eukprot:CAMPEP_0178388868 /NCGR_PEP_ID=MMETSP0689_2-20121128/9816_1 /TAXON_ID=160604 /ORGANISM="Amphidinium massartii, Strain CS-259" /LENGTH=51 /DNA_ID=CAMNT_0020009287 /DNA_START=879 /DNA_END=1034 /DNA_ORIENTATION=+
MTISRGTIIPAASMVRMLMSQASKLMNHHQVGANSPMVMKDKSAQMPIVAT